MKRTNHVPGLPGHPLRLLAQFGAGPVGLGAQGGDARGFELQVPRVVAGVSVSGRVCSEEDTIGFYDDDIRRRGQGGADMERHIVLVSEESCYGTYRCSSALSSSTTAK